jgi:hypothetical protein
MQNPWQGLGIWRRVMMFYNIISYKERKGRIILSAKYFTSRTFINYDSVTISAGQRTEKVVVVSEPDLHDDEIMVSQDILDSLSIPCDIKYQVKFLDSEIKLGPVIGLLVGRKTFSLTKERKNSLTRYTLSYPEINGLLVAFSEEDIDFENQFVNGYCYNPNSDDGSIWKKGMFPIPDSIFLRTDLNQSKRLRLKMITRNRMFNSYSFDKWEFWGMTSKFDSVRESLPYTMLLSSIKDIEFMLEHYNHVYLKPINGTLSRGIYKVTKSDSNYIFQDKEGTEIKNTSSKKEADEFVKSIAINHRYIIQQGLAPLRINGRHTDFRVIMQKDHDLEWKNTGIYAFLGKRGGICSNWGFQSTFEEVFSKYLNLSQAEIFKKKQEVIAACKNICSILDMTGENYGDLGFDALIDESQKVWILETNKRHYHVVPLWINDYQTFYEVKSNPIKYATALGGFKVY